MVIILCRNYSQNDAALVFHVAFGDTMNNFNPLLILGCAVGCIETRQINECQLWLIGSRYFNFKNVVAEPIASDAHAFFGFLNQRP